MRDLLNSSGSGLTLARNLIVVCTLAFSAVTTPAQNPAASPTEHTQITVSEKVLDGYVGKYRVDANVVITMTREGDHLYSQATGLDLFELFPQSEKEFVSKTQPIVQVTFVTNQNGIATAIVAHQGEAEFTAKRIVEVTAEGLKGQCAQIDSMVASDFARHPTGSVTVGVVLEDQLIWTKSYGEADMEKHLPADKDTIYRIGSITKMFTAVMFEQLVDAGKVHFTDPVDKYFPEIDLIQGKSPWSPPVTFFELATHTSGMGREPDNTEEYVKGAVADWEKTLIAALPHTHFISEPGTRFSYSNIGYATLGAALARVASEPYLEYVPRHIFAPLDMTHTSLVLTPEMMAHLSKGYVLENGKTDSEVPLKESQEGRGYKVPNGAIYTTVGDMAHFASFLMGNGPDGVLKKSALEADLKRTAIQSNFQLAFGYGMGDFVIPRGTYTAFGHGGDVAGYQAALFMNREINVGIILLANSTGPGSVNTNGLENGLALSALDILSK
jgi:CubicO group peptidase (beta-lactamase class C family)